MTRDRLLPRFLRRREGATALEFALVAPVFLALVLSTFEAGWLMTRAVLLDRALDGAVRLVRIGSAEAPKNQAEIRRTVCDRMMLVPGCEASLLVEMIPIRQSSDFPTSGATCRDRAAPVDPVVSYSPGQRSSVVFVRACLTVDVLTPLMGLGLALPKDASGGFGLVSSSAFLNEPA